MGRENEHIAAERPILAPAVGLGRAANPAHEVPVALGHLRSLPRVDPTYPRPA